MPQKTQNENIAAAAENFVAAIEIGSSKITGMVGRRMPDGSTQVLAMAQEKSSSCIRKGAVYNVDKTVQSLKSIKTSLQSAVGRKISRVYVCFGGQGLHSVKNTVKRSFEVTTCISQELVDTLYEENRSQSLADYYLVDIIPQEYRLGTQTSTAPVGVLSNEIEGNYLNIVIRKALYENLKSCFAQAGIEVVQFCTTPIVLADAILGVDTEKRPGCALVDMGSDTTTVAVYTQNLLRYLSVIPLGSDNITKDIAAVYSVNEDEAEQLKLTRGRAYVAPADINEDKFQLADDRTVEKRDFDDIVEARIEEILVNVADQINASGVRDSLLKGVVLTGGGANIDNIAEAFRQFAKVEKLKVTKTVNFTVNTKIAEAKAADGTLCAALGVLAVGNENCAGSPILGEDGDLFEGEQNGEENDTKGTQTNIDALNEKADEERAAEEAARKAAEEAAERARKEQEERDAAEQAKREEEERLAEQKRLEKEERRRAKEQKSAERKAKWNKTWEKVKDNCRKFVSPED